MTDPVLPSGWTLHSFDSLGSTNDEAAERASRGAAEGTVIVAREQLGGRGRRGRQWQSPPGNLYCSTILRPQCSAMTAGQLGLVAALAVADALGFFLDAGADVRLKWPNDVLVGDAKICGILSESTVGTAGSVEYVVVGIGLNVLTHPVRTAGGYAATALAALGTKIEAEQVLGRLLQALDRRYGDWRNRGFAGLRDDWTRRGQPMGSTLCVRLGTEMIEGRYAGIDADGALLLARTPGVIERILAGEILPGAPTARE